MSASAPALSRSCQVGRYAVTLDVSKPTAGRCNVSVGWRCTDLAPGEVRGGPPDLTFDERLAFDATLDQALVDAGRELGLELALEVPTAT